MVLPCYLAMTAAEIADATAFPPKTAWMACHFSASNSGLSNRPRSLPEGAMVILNDQTPIHGHDPDRIARQLRETVEETGADRVLLDLQRPGASETVAVVKSILQELSCPVGVSGLYAQESDCPVFLPPPPESRLLADYLSSWQGREIWLEAALDAEAITVTPKGTTFASLTHWDGADTGLRDEPLHCHYRTEMRKDEIRFTLFRTQQDLEALLREAADLGVTLAVGLYQELG